MSNNTKRNKPTDPFTIDLGTAVTLGTGVLDWPRIERICDRYGSLCLFSEPYSGDAIVLCQANEGQSGKLVAKVVENRKSPHLGDPTRGLRPTTPKSGELIHLGTGQLFFKTSDDVQSVGLRPKPGHHTQWLNPEALYACHFQTVTLYFLPDELRPSRHTTPPVMYRVSLQIEEFVEPADPMDDIPYPFGLLATFSTEDEANSYLHAVENVYASPCFRELGAKPYTVIGYRLDDRHRIFYQTVAATPQQASQAAVENLASLRPEASSNPHWAHDEGPDPLTEQIQVIAVFEGFLRPAA